MSLGERMDSGLLGHDETDCKKKNHYNFLGPGSINTIPAAHSQTSIKTMEEQFPFLTVTFASSHKPKVDW